jgi:hypothetical protein
MLGPAFASPYKRAQLGRAQNANNFVGENTNELATAILQVLRLYPQPCYNAFGDVTPRRWEIIISTDLPHPNCENGKSKNEDYSLLAKHATRNRHRVPPKHCTTSTRLHGVFSPVDIVRCFGGTQCLHFQDRTAMQNTIFILKCGLLWFFSDPPDKDNASSETYLEFLQNYTTSHRRK